jgi:hypothetical protein
MPAMINVSVTDEQYAQMPELQKLFIKPDHQNGTVMFTFLLHKPEDIKALVEVLKPCQIDPDTFFTKSVKAIAAVSV